MSTPTIPDTPPGVTPVVELGIGDTYDANAVAGLWGSARWSTAGDANEWGGQEPLWNDIACEVLEITTFAGRDSSIDQFEIGTATIVVRNRDGWADYKPPGAHDNILTVRPGRQIRVGVSIAGGPPHWLWRGTVDVTEPGYIPGEGDTVTFGCIDAKGDAGRADMPRTLEPVGSGELCHRRITRILDNVEWPSWRRSLDADNVALGPTDLGARASSELDRTADSASGHVYGGLAGNVVFRSKTWMLWTADTPADGSIGNVSGADVCPSGWETRFARDDLTTRAIVGRSGETPLVLDNRSGGKSMFGIETWERTDLLPLDNFEIQRIGTRALNTRNPKSMPRIAAVTLHASTGDGEVAALLATASPFKPSRYRCRHRSDAGRIVFDRLMHVTGIRHTISPVDGWTARLGLDDAAPFQTVDNPARWSDANTRWTTDDMWATSI